MLVLTMTKEEMANEVRAEKAFVLAMIAQKTIKVDRLSIKERNFPKCYHALITSKRKNKWIIKWYFASRQNVRQLCYIDAYCYFESPHGKYVVSPDVTKPNWERVSIYSPHFFNRYASRMNLRLTGIELIQNYFVKNISRDHKCETNDKGETIISCCTEEGVSMGLVTGNIEIFRTFISNDMPKGDQIEIFGELNEKREAVLSERGPEVIHTTKQKYRMLAKDPQPPIIEVIPVKKKKR